MAEVIDTRFHFVDIFGLTTAELYQILLLTLLCIVIPLVQTIYVWIWCCHPPIPNEGGSAEPNAQHIKDTKANFKDLVKSILLTVEPRHVRKIFDWLDTSTLNTNNYTELSRINDEFPDLNQEATQSLEDGRMAYMKNIDTKRWIKEVFDDAVSEQEAAYNEHEYWINYLIKGEWKNNAGEEQNITNEVIRGYLKDNLSTIQNHLKETAVKSELPMMTMINHHVLIIGCTTSLAVWNPTMLISKETELRQARLPFSGIVEVLRTVDLKPRFPGALNLSVVRQLQDPEEWSYTTKGNRLTPILLSEKPWPEIRIAADAYISSFIKDLWFYWGRNWIVLVFLQIILV